MATSLDVITVNWLIPRAAIGVSCGYVLRVIEHVIWASKSPAEHNPLGNFRFSLMILPQCALFGVALGCVLLAIVAKFFDNWLIIEICSVGMPALTSFLAVDLRELLRRISRI